MNIQEFISKFHNHQESTFLQGLVHAIEKMLGYIPKLS